MIACPSCQASNPAGAGFCGSCGSQLLAATGAAASAVAYAGFWIRFVAYIIDGLILIVPNFIIQVLVKDFLPVLIFQIALGALYTIGFWSMEGATPGKMAMGLKITTVEGEPIEVGAAALRYVGYFASAIILGIGFLMIAFTGEKRGLHDQIAGTIVIKTR